MQIKIRIHNLYDGWGRNKDKVKMTNFEEIG